jgi:hypothetical protein
MSRHHIGLSEFASICYSDETGASRFSGMTGECVCPCADRSRENFAVVVDNDVARTITLQWYSSGDVVPLQPGRNIVRPPYRQQIERAKFAYDISTPRYRLLSCPWMMLQIGGRYRVREENDSLTVAAF